MTDSLNQVSQEMQGYLNQVNDVLIKGFEGFGDAVESSLTRALGSFDNTLEQAVKRLAGAIEGLDEVAEELADMAQRHTKH
jgi:DNA anti-recombination protein RmuC